MRRNIHSQVHAAESFLEMWWGLLAWSRKLDCSKQSYQRSHIRRLAGLSQHSICTKFCLLNFSTHVQMSSECYDACLIAVGATFQAWRQRRVRSFSHGGISKPRRYEKSEASS
jgi:hypothetical protein